MSKRKAHSMHKRMQRARGALLRTNHVALVHLEPEKQQRLFSMRNLKEIQPTPIIVNAMADYSHQWTIYFAGFCVDQRGDRYIKGAEVPLPCGYVIDNLHEGIEDMKASMLDSCNPNHAVGCGFIAVPKSVEIDEALAFEIFEKAGAWSQQTAA